MVTEPPIIHFLLGSYFTTLIAIFPFVILFLAAALHAMHRERQGLLSYKVLIATSLAVRVVVVCVSSFLQYYVWNQTPFTRDFLKQRLQQDLLKSSLLKFVPFFQGTQGYYWYYIFLHFIAQFLLAIILATIFYYFLRFLRRYRERFFDVGEPELGFLTAFLCGWPGFVFFLPLVFLGVVLFSLARGIFLKEPYTTLGWPFIVACVLVLVFGGALITALHFEFLIL